MGDTGRKGAETKLEEAHAIALERRFEAIEKWQATCEARGDKAEEERDSLRKQITAMLIDNAKRHAGNLGVGAGGAVAVEMVIRSLAGGG